MEQYISKSALVAEIKRRIGCFKNERNTLVKASDNNLSLGARIAMCEELIVFIDTLEVKEVGISIPNIDDTLKEEGLDPDSKEAKVFKESYYMALEKLKAQKGEKL